MDRLPDEDLALLLLIRFFERKLLALFERGELNGTTHTCLGQEYVPVSLRPLLRDGDWVFSNHRGHGHYLARFEDPEGLLAEIMGRKGAVCDGVGGSQHLRRERYLSTGVQGQSLPVAAGVALRLKRHEPGALACVYVGDGTWGEGAVYEALNLTQLWRLPLLVVVEHNGIAQSTPTELQMAGTIEGRARGFDIRHHRLDTSDISRIRAELAPLVERTRAESSPLVAEFATHRLGPHSKGDDTRPPDFPRPDWYGSYQAEHPEQSARLEVEARARVDRIADEVAARPPAVWTAA
ncbi:thiamine pyrophosphate-dependent dehydrogenase E1 component subunit alpha [Nonomuraea sp. NPDC000554]|uniref:thiamine pyrophosphate-dependent dehydrogenase E1 component subunit alpha n=1 Tax=Nonomuraea sp. NPDC000554 TaxID=3154259 RepID=UPI00332648C8